LARRCVAAAARSLGAEDHVVCHPEDRCTRRPARQHDRAMQRRRHGQPNSGRALRTAPSLRQSRSLQGAECMAPLHLSRLQQIESSKQRSNQQQLAKYRRLGRAALTHGTHTRGTTPRPPPNHAWTATMIRAHHISHHRHGRPRAVRASLSPWLVAVTRAR
jgi:hypothetical protein